MTFIYADDLLTLTAGLFENEKPALGNHSAEMVVCNKGCTHIKRYHHLGHLVLS